MVDFSDAEWRKSSRSNMNGCVEVAFVEGRVAVRDSKDRQGPVLLFTSQEWATFIDAARNGAFELRLHHRTYP
jgi:Domain of unknown function (DUF397)